MATDQHTETEAHPFTKEKDKSLFVGGPVRKCPEPVASSTTKMVEEEDDEHDDHSKLLTPPASEKKGSAASKTQSGGAKAKPTSAPTKKSSEGMEKTGRANGPNGDARKANVDGGKATKVGAGDKGNAKKSSTSKSTSAQVNVPDRDVPSRAEVGSNAKMDPTVYSTQIFDIFVGPSKAHFMAHEAILFQSPLLAHLIEKQVGKKGKLKTTLVLPRESPTNFGTLLQYLYSHQLVMPSLNGQGDLSCDTDGEEAKAAAKLLAKLYVLAHNYEMNGMEERIIGVLELTGLMEKIPGLEFFELAEKLYPDDAEDVEDDEFAKHFNKVAPELIRTVPDKDLPQLMRMVSAGGAYAEAIFLSYNTAVKMGAGFSAGVKVKREEMEGEGQEPLENDRQSKRARVESVETEDL